MKILLDECVTKRLKPFLRQHKVYTVREMGWTGVKNGALLTKCVANDFDLILTIDKNILHQQNLAKYQIALVVLDSLTSKVEELKTFVPILNERISEIKSGNVLVLRKL